VLFRSLTLKGALTALLRLVAGATGGVRGVAAVGADRVTVTLTRRGGDDEAVPTLAGTLIDAAGGTRLPADATAVAFSLESQP